MPPVHTEIVPLETLTDADVQAWRELAARALEPNVSFEPDFVLPVARVIDPGRVQLLRVAEGADWIGCIPVVRPPRSRGIPMRVLAGWRHLYSLLGTPLVDAEHAEDALSAMLDGARRLSGASLVAIDLVTADGPTALVARELLAAQNVASLQRSRGDRAVLRRRPEEDYLEVSVKHRREWQRQRRRLAALLDADVETHDRSGDETAVEDFLRLEAAGWKGKAGTAFESLPGHREIFVGICDRYRAAGRLQLLALESGSRRLAVKCNLLAGDEIFCFKIAYDEELAKYSPGIQLELDNVRIFHQVTDATLIDSCAAFHHPMINRLWPDRRELEILAFAAKPVRGRIGLGALAAAVRLRSRREG
jgi:CelD/BcsL family acetyltransferase involved in cellulose biosynthesis